MFPHDRIARASQSRHRVIGAVDDHLCPKLALDIRRDAAADSGTQVKLFDHDMAKSALLTFNTAHTFEHYGNIITYLRIKGLVPPSSEGRPAQTPQKPPESQQK